MVKTLNFLLKSCENKTARKGQVRECLKTLLARPPWMAAARADTDEERKAALIEFVKASSDMEELAAALEAEPAAVEAEPEVKADATPETAEEDPDATTETTEESAADFTKRLLDEGVAIMRESDFSYPTGLHTEEASDRALEGFSSFYKGVTRLHTAATLSGSKIDGDMYTDSGVLKDISDEDMPKILKFLGETYRARALHRGMVLFCVDKLNGISEPFKQAVEERSSDSCRDESIRLPWLPPPPEVPEEPAEVVDGPPTHSIPVMSKMLPDAKKSVVWIDGKPDSYNNATVLKEAGLNVVGFHDDWSRGPSKASEAALTYIVNAISTPNESIVAVIVNNGPTHKQMIGDVRRFCETQARDPPVFAACTMRGTAKDFEACGGVSIIDKDRVVVQTSVVEMVK